LSFGPAFGEGHELPVQAGKPATGSFTLHSAGSFEVESHHLENPWTRRNGAPPYRIVLRLIDALLELVAA
jgi:hypothetical protein